MQILCQPFFLLNPLILGIYYVLKIRRLQCYKYTFVLQVFDELSPYRKCPYKLSPYRLFLYIRFTEIFPVFLLCLKNWNQFSQGNG